MNGMQTRLFPVLLATITLPAAAATLDYDETSDGDLSDVFGAPTMLVLDVGMNTITGIMGTPGGGATNGTDADYFWFNLSAGQSIDSIKFTRSGPGSGSFVGYKAGSAFSGQAIGDIDAWTLFSDGEDVIGDLPAIGTGDQAFWIQETAGTTTYSVTLNVVPEPAGLALLGASALALLRRRRP